MARTLPRPGPVPATCVPRCRAHEPSRRQVGRSDLFDGSTSNSTDAPVLRAGKGEELTVDLLPSHGVHVVVAAVASLGAKPSPLRTIAFVPNRPDGPRSLRRNVDRSGPGPSHARETVGWLTAQFPDLEMSIVSLVADGDMVRRPGPLRRHLGRLGGFAPPTNKRFVAEQSHWYRVADGRLCEHWATRDALSTMLQLGVIQTSRTTAACSLDRRVVNGSSRLLRPESSYGSGRRRTDAPG